MWVAIHWEHHSPSWSTLLYLASNPLSVCRRCRSWCWRSTTSSFPLFELPEKLLSQSLSHFKAKHHCWWTRDLRAKNYSYKQRLKSVCIISPTKSHCGLWPGAAAVADSCHELSCSFSDDIQWRCPKFHKIHQLGDPRQKTHLSSAICKQK